MSEIYYRIDSGSKFQYIAVLKFSNYPSGKPCAASLDLGGIKKGCVQITVKLADPGNKDERFRNVKDSDVAYVSWIGHAEECSLTSDMPSGVGTRHMVRTAFSIVQAHFGDVKKFKLMDSSEINCLPLDRKVSLADIQLSLHGKTYYERYFGAYLEFEPIRTDYYERVESMRRSTLDPFELFCSQFKIPNDYKSCIEKPYNESSSYAEFFQKLREQCEFEYCFMTSEWLERFLVDKLTNRYKNNDWIIDMAKVKPVQYSSRAMTADEYEKMGSRLEQRGGGGGGGCVPKRAGMTLGPMDIH